MCCTPEEEEADLWVVVEERDDEDDGDDGDNVGDKGDDKGEGGDKGGEVGGDKGDEKEGDTRVRMGVPGARMCPGNPPPHRRGSMCVATGERKRGRGG